MYWPFWCNTPGDLVKRETLQEQLWPDDTLVDFEHILNNGIGRLREVLGDQADSPKFIETLPRRGYRFIARVSASQQNPMPDCGGAPRIESTAFTRPVESRPAKSKGKTLAEVDTAGRRNGFHRSFNNFNLVLAQAPASAAHRFHRGSAF